MNFLLTNVLPLNDLESGYTLLSIVLAFFVIMIVADIAALFYTVFKKDKSKKIVIISEVIILVLLFMGVFCVEDAITQIVGDIVANYPGAGYFIR